MRDDTLYVAIFGPGFGESAVVRVPPATWLVVDGCRVAGQSAPARLLMEEGAEWSAVILTHPHADHAGGLDEVLEGPATAGALLGCVKPSLEDPSFWVRSSDADEHVRKGPLEHVVAAFNDAWERFPGSRWDLRRGERRHVGDAILEALHPDAVALKLAHDSGDLNRLSSALMVHWRSARVVLGGDVVSPDWATLARDAGALELHGVLKVPHHGSLGAQHAIWTEHPDRDRTWIVTPFNRGRTLPRFDDGEGLHRMLDHVERVHLTRLPHGGGPRVAGGGPVPRPALRDSLAVQGSFAFKPRPAPPAADARACSIAFELDEDGRLVSLVPGAEAVTVVEEP